MKSESNARNERVKRTLRKRMKGAEYAGSRYPNYHIQIESACRQGVKRQIVTAFYYHEAQKNSPVVAGTTAREK